MSYRRNGLKVLGLSFMAVLGLMAYMAGGAQANWLFLHEGKTVENTAVVPVAVSPHTDGTLLVADGFSTAILCKKVEGVDLLLAAKSTTAAGKVAFSECTTFQKGVAAPNCNPINQPIVAGGTAQLVLNTAKNYVLFAPEAGKPFATIFFGELCALGEEIPVTGTLMAECGKLVTGVFTGVDCKEHEVTHLLQAAPEQAKFGDSLKFGKSTATLDGIAAVTISEGLYKGESWGGHI